MKVTKKAAIRGAVGLGGLALSLATLGLLPAVVGGIGGVVALAGAWFADSPDQKRIAQELADLKARQGSR